MHLVRRELGALPVAHDARLTESSGVEHRVLSGCLIVVAALASGRDRRRGRRKATRTGHHRLGADVVHLIGIRHVASGANAQVARKSYVLIIRGSQDIRIYQRLAAMDTVDLNST